ncbi:GNAT family N-acetyltransferase [Mucilaginibacter agri]|uniref:GNAT family N-acetyltransferase n=1 Tax=Mucilaginibacter agri TaxID=2695265 RepID=A0A965ZK41_9SPHI|nr:GNAT family N-acetyltransferase [Mucilaginibacter agri]NCD71518.1 GNAT family N-acetyltransferase [Mucilaginibacter agri]
MTTGMNHILDNIIWNALCTGNADLAIGNDIAKYYARDVAPFVGLKDNSQQSFDALHDLLSFKDIGVHFTAEEIEIPANWKSVHQLNVLQMVYESPNPPADETQQFVDLGEDHITQMLALTKLTSPGPFFNRTIVFGNYTGVFVGNQLVSMAGQRMQPSPYVEISAVCTHPDHVGKGYAAIVIREQIRRIIAQGQIPFLHVRNDNAGAIKLYEKLGFVNRKEIIIYNLQKL